jgi:uncharacterized Tic20 family protein
MSLTDELQKLQQLYQSGAINDDEYALAKARLLRESAQPPLEAQPAPLEAQPAGRPSAPAPASVEEQTRTWAMFLHLSVLAGCAVPVAGLVVPIVIWQLKKDELPGIDAHGKVVVNWIISLVIYAAACVLLVFVIVGIFLLIALGVLAVVFPVVGAIKANNGEVWRYPLAIPFLG